MIRPGVTIVPIHGHTPKIHDSAFIAPGCTIIGNVAPLHYQDTDSR